MSRAELEHRTRQSYILEAARGLFAEQNLENCTMEEIAKVAEYTRRTLYSYFKSRDELYLRIHLEDLVRAVIRCDLRVRCLEQHLLRQRVRRNRGPTHPQRHRLR